MLLWSASLLTWGSFAQKPISLTIDTSSRVFAIPADFSGLGFETKSVLPNQYGVPGYFFGSENTELITLFRNMGVKNIRVGGGTVDGSGQNERCETPMPTEKDIDHLFGFARAAGIDVIYSVRLLNADACKDPHLASEDAAIANYVWNKYRPTVTSLSIGNEPDVRQYHSYPGRPSDSAIFESTPGVAGSAYPSYFAAWKGVADAILKSVPDARFSGPETAVSSTSSFTPNPATGMSWTEKFGADLKDSGILIEALQHHYVWGSPGNTTTQEAIDDMLSSAWDNGSAVGHQPAMDGGTAEFHPYPFVYNRVLSSLVSMRIPFRMTEANDCLHGVVGASNGYAAALWALDYMHWWAAHHMAGVNFHNNPWLPTDTVVPDPNPCPPKGCSNYRITAKGYGIKAFDVGGHGYEMPVAISNPIGMNLTAYAVGTDQDLYVTIINRTHSTTHDAADANVVIDAKGMKASSASAMALSGGEPGDATSMTASLGGAAITNNSRWLGKWTPIGRVETGRITVTVKSTTAVIVRIHGAGALSGPVQSSQSGDLDFFVKDSHGKVLFNQQKTGADNELAHRNWNEIPGSLLARETPAVIRNEDNTLEVFAIATDGRVYHNRETSPEGPWGQWSALGNEHITQVTAAQNADGSLSVFGIGTNGDLWTNSESAPEVGWTGWRDLGAKRIEPGYAVGQELSGRLDVFGVDDRGTVWQNKQTDADGWSGWSSLPGTIRPSLGVGRDLDGRLEVFAIGSDGQLKRMSQVEREGKWGAWTPLGRVKVEPGFAVGQYADGRLAVFAVGAGAKCGSENAAVLGANQRAHTIWTIAQQRPGKSFGKWSNIGTADIDRIALGNDSQGRIHLFGTNARSEVMCDWQLGPGNGWTGWVNMTAGLSATAAPRSEYGRP